MMALKFYVEAHRRYLSRRKRKQNGEEVYVSYVRDIE